MNYTLGRILGRFYVRESYKKPPSKNTQFMMLVVSLCCFLAIPGFFLIAYYTKGLTLFVALLSLFFVLLSFERVQMLRKTKGLITWVKVSNMLFSSIVFIISIASIIFSLF